MPFPLAHPAAVLPLRRYCLRFLSFPALIIGSLVPDAGYGFGKWNAAWPSHSFTGGIVFCLPIGLLCLWVLYRIRLPLAGVLPPRYRQVFLPLCQQSARSLPILVLSLMIGVWTHLFWDALTHQDGWFVEHLVFLQRPVGSIGNHRLRVCHLLWYSCTFAGVLWLCLAYLKWLSVATGSRKFASARARLVYGLIFGALVMPLAAAHHLIHHTLEIYVVSLCMVLMVLGFAFTAETRRGGEEE